MRKVYLLAITLYLVVIIISVVSFIQTGNGCMINEVLGSISAIIWCLIAFGYRNRYEEKNDNSN